MTKGKSQVTPTVSLDIVPANMPLLPTFDKLAPYMRQIDLARYYTNNGGMHEVLKERLAQHFSIERENIAIASSGTSALIGAILALTGFAARSRPLCLCASYTFVATAAAAEACGYTPFLVDIDPDTWSADPSRLLLLSDIERAGVAIVVAPYGRMVDLSAWREFSKRAGIPVIIDAAASFDTVDAPAICGSSLLAAISLHATKTFSTAEGGLIIGGAADVIARAERALNFGFYGSRESIGPSINGKISEYHAAIGLAELDGWRRKRDGYRASAVYYAAAAASHGLGDRIVVDVDHANPYALFLADNERQAGATVEALRRERIETRLWYGRGLHRQPHYADCPAERLDVTDGISARLLGLPFAVDLLPSVVERIVATIAAVLI